MSRTAHPVDSHKTLDGRQFLMKKIPFLPTVGSPEPLNYSNFSRIQGSIVKFYAFMFNIYTYFA